MKIAEDWFVIVSPCDAPRSWDVCLKVYMNVDLSKSVMGCFALPDLIPPMLPVEVSHFHENMN